MTFHCPHCHAAAGTIPPAGSAKVACPNCTFHYRIVSGRVTERSSREVVHRHDRATGVTHYDRRYTLRLQKGEGSKLEYLTLPGREDRLPVDRGQVVALVYTTAVVDRLVAVVNLTTGEELSVRAPGGGPPVGAWLRGGVTLPVVGGLLWLAGLALPATIVVASAAALGTGWWQARGARSPRRLAAGDLSAVGERNALGAERETARARIREIAQQQERRRDLRSRLLELGARMEEVDAQLYAARRETMAAGVLILDRQMELDARLMEGYEKRIKMLGIEIDVSRASEAMPGDLHHVLVSQQEELDRIAEAYRDLEFQLAANDEVERLLRSG